MANVLLKMDNAREVKMTDREIGYTAGIIDADGCIGSQKNSNARTYRPYLVVIQKNPAVIDWLHERFGGCVNLVYRQHGEKRHSYLRVSWTNQKAAIILKLCLDSLVEKREQAKLAIALVESTKSGCLKGLRVPDEVIERQKNIYIQIRGLNTPATTERVDALKAMQQSELARMRNRQREGRSTFSTAE